MSCCVMQGYAMRSDVMAPDAVLQLFVHALRYSVMFQK